jgi:hypothetical protein
MIRLELWVEGPTDALTSRPGEAARHNGAAGGALIPILRKALGDDAPPEERIDAHRLTGRLRGVTRLGDRERRRKLSIKGWKVLAAIDQVQSRDREVAIVAVWDRDGEDEPLRDRDIIHDALRERAAPGACIGICVEEIEAWLLADPGAFKRCFGRGPQRGFPGDPEADPDPKATLESVLPDEAEEDRTVLYQKLAEAIDLDVLERHCPRGFGALRRALEEFIRPHFREDGHSDP